jgi:hypothetical protein
MSESVKCKCGEVLSVNGLGWVKQGYRVSRRNIDGSPIRGTVSRPTIEGAMCRRCVDEAVTRRRRAIRGARRRQEYDMSGQFWIDLTDELAVDLTDADDVVRHVYANVYRASDRYAAIVEAS